MLNLSEVFVQPVRPLEEQRFQQLMQAHHYLDVLPKISETLAKTGKDAIHYKQIL